MRTPDGVCIPDYLPPCYCRHNGMGKDLTTGEYVYPPTKPVYVRINGRKREAKRWLWLWQIVACIQGAIA